MSNEDYAGLIERLKSGIWLRRYPQDAPDHLYPSDEPLEAAAALTSISAERDALNEENKTTFLELSTAMREAATERDKERARATASEAEATSLRRKLEELRQAYESARYVPGDHPVIPAKIDAFMKVAARALSGASE